MVIVVCIASSMSVSCGSPRSDPRNNCRTESDPASFVVLPDTQFYACGYPEIFESQTNWVVDNVESFDIGLVLHTGDIVDAPNGRQQWSVAATSLHVLDGHVPYLLPPGNHDLNAMRASLLDDYFSASDLSQYGCTEMGFKDPGKIGNGYAIAELRGVPWLFIGLEFAPGDATIEWARDVMREHAELPTVLITHAYLYSDGERYDRSVQPQQRYHPDSYEITSKAQGVADGQDIWEALIEPYENVEMVISGHVIPDGIARSVARRESGSFVHEILVNFQHCALCPCEEVKGGGGYLRIFELNETQTTFHVSTYSPHSDRFLRGEEHEFDLRL